MTSRLSDSVGFGEWLGLWFGLWLGFVLGFGLRLRLWLRGLMCQGNGKIRVMVRIIRVIVSVGLTVI